MSFGIKVTENVKKSINYANNIAFSYNNYQIGTEHILYGLACVKDATASKVLQQYGVTADMLDRVFSKNNSKRAMINLVPSIDMTPRTQEVFTIANQFALQIGQSYIATEHVLISLLMLEDCYAVKILQKAFGVDIEQMKSTILGILKKEAGFTSKSTQNVQPEEKYRQSAATSVGNRPNVSQQGSALPQELLEMGQDLTLKAQQGKIDKVIGRTEETARVIEILCRKTKNNPVLVGEAGVGKSAVIDGLALAIVNNEVPEELRGKTIFSLELGGLMAGHNTVVL